MTDWKVQYEGLLKSPFGQEILRALKEDIHDNLIKQAREAPNMETSYGFTKEAAGVIRVIEHLTTGAVL